MNGSLEETACEQLESFADVDNEGVRGILRPFPFFRWTSNLKGKDRLREQKCEGTPGSVSSKIQVPVLLVVILSSRVVDHVSEMFRALPAESMCCCYLLFSPFQHHRNEREKFP